jgi:hypothetical protein
VLAAESLNLGWGASSDILVLLVERLLKLGKGREIWWKR